MIPNGQSPSDGPPWTASVPNLLSDLSMPLEAVANLLYLLRKSDLSAEYRDQFVTMAEDRLKDVAAIMNRYDAAYRENNRASDLPSE